MDKYYNTKEIRSGWLFDVSVNGRSYGGIKNVIGIIVNHNNEKLFYSIFDDCYFRIAEIHKSIDHLLNCDNEIFVNVYDANAMMPVGLSLYEKIRKDKITKEELVGYKDYITGYYSDLDYNNINNVTDNENRDLIDEYTITTIEEYMEKLNRFITYNQSHINGPRMMK